MAGGGGVGPPPAHREGGSAGTAVAPNLFFSLCPPTATPPPPARARPRGAPPPANVPIIVFSLGTHGNWDDLLATGANVLGIDWRFPLADARRLLPRSRGLQGNLAPALLSDATPETVAAETSRLLEVMRGRNGYIFKLGHGVPPEARLENIA